VQPELYAANGILENWRRKIMAIKYILAVALITPFLTVPSTAQQYQGGPKSSVPLTTQQIGYGDIYAQGIDVYAPQSDIYAPRGDIYAQGVRTNISHAYRSGPRIVVPYGR
jgi:hypothetical protein